MNKFIIYITQNDNIFINMIKFKYLKYLCIYIYNTDDAKQLIFFICKILVYSYKSAAMWLIYIRLTLFFYII